MIEYLDLEDVLAINQIITDNEAVRDYGLLQSAVARPATTVFGDEAYPTLWEKAAALMESIARNHAFVDGNKRTAWRATWAFLEINGELLDEPLDVDAAESLVLAVAQGHMDVKRTASELVKFGER